MKRLFLQPLIKGSMVVIPLLVTVWLIWSALLWFNNLGSRALMYMSIPELFPGMGLVLMLVTLLVVGLLFQFNPVSWLYQYVEDALLRFPLVKTLYGAIKDFAAMFDQEKRQHSQQTVLVDIPGQGRLVGFITSTRTPQAVIDASDGEELVAVYLPMSYMVGGYTLFLPRAQVTEVDWSFEDAMRFTLTAGVSQSQARPRSSSDKPTL
ncbi:MAG: hypothetical protein CMI02_04555 [Oceanospirillaceae bacterium]|nr:hypothetical protein [Oceanospirillaceae bacterium]MBT11290.1 hypothetical protein [Oceanospirillaceae bacterium]|tara:strand:- start:83337 stop:83960 length:624 start_codon:yes stop_codon:yes gene_type:complete